MKIAKFSIDDSQYGGLKPIEDSFLIEDNIFSVADGITRDPISPLDFRDLSTEELLKNYPKPSPAKAAADLCCRSFIKFSRKNPNPKLALIFANNQIRKMNKQRNPHPNYLVNDFWACVAAGAVINQNKLHWATIGDCQVAIFHNGGKLKFLSPDGVEDFRDYISKNSGHWRNPDRRRYIRSQFRNNPKNIVAGKCVGYGALTGEKNAEKFIISGSREIKKGDLAVLFTDGFAGVTGQKEAPRWLSKSFEDQSSFINYDQVLARKDYQKFGRERTLIAVQINRDF